MWSESGPGIPRRSGRQERLSCLVSNLTDASDPRTLLRPTTASHLHVKFGVAALICALLWYGSVGKHLFPRHALLHLSGVTASACKQGGANCLSLSFYGSKAEQTNKPENFTHRPVKHSLGCYRRQVFASPFNRNSSVYTWKAC